MVKLPKKRHYSWYDFKKEMNIYNVIGQEGTPHQYTLSFNVTDDTFAFTGHLKNVHVKVWLSEKLMRFLSIETQEHVLLTTGETNHYNIAIVKPQVLVDTSPLIFTPFIREPLWFKVDGKMVEIPLGEYWTKNTMNEAFKIECSALPVAIVFFISTQVPGEIELKIKPKERVTVELSEFWQRILNVGEKKIFEADVHQ